MATGKDRQPEHLTGRVVQSLVRPGSAGEHDAVVLQLAEGPEIILQRRGGNPFDDPDTKRLVGHTVRVTGFRIGEVFRFIDAEVLDE